MGRVGMVSTNLLVRGRTTHADDYACLTRVLMSMWVEGGARQDVAWSVGSSVMKGTLSEER
jgi:hypothetical protein